MRSGWQRGIDTQGCGEERRQLQTGDVVSEGETTLWIDIPTEQGNSAERLPPEEPESELPSILSERLSSGYYS